MSDWSRDSDCNNSSCGLSSEPRWMKRVLLAAGLYHLIWGGFAILFPNALFEWADIQPMPNYPQFWQCIGMIVGVYGVGYVIAAFDPYRHWPIVLVGLLGKIFGPIGFMRAVASGDFPLAMGWTILANDLIWWGPFCLILWNAARANQSHLPAVDGASKRVEGNPLESCVSQNGASIAELSSDRPVMLVFLRHAGCTFCREAVSDLASARRDIESRGTQIAFVHMGAIDIVQLLRQHGMDDLHRFHDGTGALYDAFELGLGSFRQVFGLRVWIRGVAAFFRGHGVGRLEGNGFRMPGVFLISNGDVLRSYRHQTAADRPDYIDLATVESGPPSEPLPASSVS